MSGGDRMDKVNKHVQRTFAEVLHRDADVPVDVMVTISRVDTTRNLKTTNVWLYINPLERAEEILGHLEKQLYDLQGALNRKLDLKPLPRVRLRIDSSAHHAEQIEQTIKRLNDASE